MKKILIFLPLLFTLCSCTKKSNSPTTVPSHSINTTPTVISSPEISSLESDKVSVEKDLEKMDQLFETLDENDFNEEDLSPLL